MRENRIERRCKVRDIPSIVCVVREGNEKNGARASGRKRERETQEIVSVHYHLPSLCIECPLLAR